MTIPVVWLNFNQSAPARGYWDQGMLEDLFSHDMWRPAGHHIFVHHEEIPPMNGGIFVVPGRQNASFVHDVNRALEPMEWALVIITGDEEGEFPVEQLIKKDRLHVWLMTPQKGRDYGPEVTRFLGTGYPREMRQHLRMSPPEPRSQNLFFMGQDTHQRRHDCIAALKDTPMSEVVGTPGFIQGIDQGEYWNRMAHAKLAPAPGGPVSPDSFRAFEALEAGSVPLLDVASGKDQFPEFWELVFGPERPTIEVTNWKSVKHTIMRMVNDYPRLNNETFAWFQMWKRKLAYHLRDEVNALSQHGGEGEISDQITILIPSSPIVSHPSTDIIEETVGTIRSYKELEHAEIIIMLDGVRAEQENRRADYEEYTRRLLWLANHHWRNVIVQRHNEHMHQGMMTKKALESMVQTPFVLFVEQDTPLCEPIEWAALIEAIRGGHANVIRMHHEALILPDHEHLMLGPARNVAGALMRRTYQWSQRPHLASTDFYRWMINTYFGNESRTMIEDVMYSVVETHYRERGDEGWNKFKLWIYTPRENGHIKRSYHMDGRAGESKYSMTFAYDDEGAAEYAPFPGVIDG